MATTSLVSFAPTGQSPFQFTCTLDSNQYTVVVRWNVAGQRWYIWIYDATGVVVLCKAMVGSPPNYNISLVWGVFNDTFVYRTSTNNFEITNL